MNIKLFKLVIRLIMYVIIFEDLIMTLHCGLLLTGINSWITEYLCGHSLSGFIILVITSFLLKFCWLYRTVLTHSFLIYTCIVYQREFGFGILAQPLRTIFFISGIILITLMIRKVHYGEFFCKR